MPDFMIAFAMSKQLPSRVSEEPLGQRRKTLHNLLPTCRFGRTWRSLNNSWSNFYLWRNSGCDRLKAPRHEFDLEWPGMIVAQKVPNHRDQFPLKFLDRIGLCHEADIADSGCTPHTRFFIPKRFDKDLHAPAPRA
jgi:hypothetical protein